MNEVPTCNRPIFFNALVAARMTYAVFGAIALAVRSRRYGRAISKGLTVCLGTSRLVRSNDNRLTLSEAGEFLCEPEGRVSSWPSQGCMRRGSAVAGKKSFFAKRKR